MKLSTKFLPLLLAALFMTSCEKEEPVSSDPSILKIQFEGKVYEVPRMIDQDEAYKIIQADMEGTLTDDQMLTIFAQLENQEVLTEKKQTKRSINRSIDVDLSSSDTYNYALMKPNNGGWVKVATLSGTSHLLNVNSVPDNYGNCYDELGDGVKLYAKAAIFKSPYSSGNMIGESFNIQYNFDDNGSSWCVEEFFSVNSTTTGVYFKFLLPGWAYDTCMPGIYMEVGSGCPN